VSHSEALLVQGITLSFLLGFVVCLLILLWSGVQWAVAKKDKAKRARAKRRTLWSLAGLVAFFVGFFIFNVILGLFVDTVRLF
jgi:cation transport ATPase